MCNNNQQGSFRIVLTTPTTDIAGITSTLRAAVAPITIKRPLGLSQVSITTSKTPVNSGEIFKLYINIPTSTVIDNSLLNNYRVRISALCPSGVIASIAGNVCGQEFVLPFTSLSSAQQEVPAIITNGTWYTQDVTFMITVVNLAGQVIATSKSIVTANGIPIAW